jgi:hypothetical protein
VAVLVVSELAVMDWSFAESLVIALPGTVSSGHRPELSTVQSILAAMTGPDLFARPCRIANIARPALVETPHLA